ncbi:hypothetical protein M569_01786 [Genlisea aurea]|uniref:Uncharacterized protein n=1 Tax=Genlisea aurea TaxID=192259 RepID=S8EAR4_9LAMI|nr:hypothetical protein M569_01786 [Genlisea aurea]
MYTGDDSAASDALELRRIDSTSEICMCARMTAFIMRIDESDGYETVRSLEDILCCLAE